MPGDGVSLQTIISQMGSVAKAQARGQQTPQAAAPFSEMQDQNDELKIHRVQETAEARKGRIEAEEDAGDKRKRRRLRRRRKETDREAAEEQVDESAGTEGPVGSLVDLRI